MEIHVPKEFTPERPAVSYRHVSHMDMNIDEHPLASKLPKETAEPSIQAEPDVTIDLLVNPKAPHCLEDYLKSDAPLLDLSIISFKDCTLVNILLPHILGDAMTVAAMGEMWSLCLAGRGSEARPNLSAYDDGMATAGLDPAFQERHVMEDRQLKGIWFLIWIARFMLDMWWWPKMETRTIFLPATSVSKLKSDVSATLSSSKSVPSSSEHRQKFISTADALFAWISCMAMSIMLPRSSRRSVLLGFPCDTRERAPSIFPRAKEGVYFQNAAPPLVCVVPARDMMPEKGSDEKLGNGINVAVARVAQSIRYTIGSQGTEGQIHAAARLARKALKQQGMPAIFGDPLQAVVTTTNWTKARWFEEYDFSPAIMAPKDGNGTPKAQSREDGYKPYHVPGKPVYFHINEIHPPTGNKNNLSRNFAYLIANPEGSYWMVAKFPPAVWKNIEKDLKERSM